jgi:hypothetical protein
MAEPSDSSSVGSGTLEILPTPSNGIVDDGNEAEVSGESGEAGAEGNSSSDSSTGKTLNEGETSAARASNVSSPTPSPAAEKLDESVEKIFDAKASRSRMLIVDEVHTATSKQGITSTFTFNPTKEDPFKDVSANILIEDVIFSVYPESSEWLVATDVQGLKHYLYFGSMKYVFDEFGKVWSGSKLSQGTLRIEVVMQPNGVEVKEIFVGILSKG